MNSLLPYVVLEKPVGETPLGTLQAWRLQHPAYAEVSATYAGRLDPMASGKLLILLGEECKRREEYIGLDKEYVVDVVLDLSTDTGDALGISTYAEAIATPNKRDVLDALASLTGSETLPYPAFSSKTVNGAPLFMYALSGTLNTITIPQHIETVYRAELLKIDQVSRDELRARITTHLSLAPRASGTDIELGRDFRQEEVRAAWDDVFARVESRSFTIISLRITCASGTYMRTFAERLGAELGTTACALSIHRTKIGTYKKLGSLGYWRNTY